MTQIRLIFSALVISLLFSCSATRPVGSDDGKIETVFIQVNDVYEIAPLAGGSEGGLARLASLKKQYLASNPNTFMVMAGDFLSPSVYNSLFFEGKPIRGRQMVEAMNAAGMDLAIFGNHEFDIKENELQARIDESSFQWVSSNTFHKKGDSISAFVHHSDAYSFPTFHSITVTDADGTKARIGFIAITMPFNQAGYVHYTDALTTAKNVYDQYKDSVDAIVALTHQSVEDDKKLAAAIPGLAMIIGGHEHDMRILRQGKVYITKAHANAKSAYVIRLVINKKKNSLTTTPQLVFLDEKIPFDSATNRVVEKWTDIADKNYKEIGFNAKRIVLNESEPLEGREGMIRSRSTNLTKLITSSMQNAAPQADIVLFNAGSIRVDDIIQMPVTEYDIIRTLPFGGGIVEADIKGDLLIKVLDQGWKNKGTGGFLHYNETLSFEGGQWKLKGRSIEPAAIYRVALSEFLISGREANLEFLSPSNPGVIKIYKKTGNINDPLSDIRLALIRYLDQIEKEKAP